MHISQAKSSRTANRNRVFLHAFAEKVLSYTTGLDDDKTKDFNTSNYDDNIEKIIDQFGTNKEINDYFDKFTLAYGIWVLRVFSIFKNKSIIEKDLIRFREYQLTAKDEEQVDYCEKDNDKVSYSDNYSNWCISCQGTNCIC